MSLEQMNCFACLPYSVFSSNRMVSMMLVVAIHGLHTNVN